MKIQVEFAGRQHQLEGTTGYVVLTAGLIVRSDRPPFVSIRLAGSVDGAPVFDGEYVEFADGQVAVGAEIVEL